MKYEVLKNQEAVIM